MASQGRLRTFVSQWWPCLLLVCAFWAVRYWHSAEFGLYEDDLTHLPAAAAMSGRELIRFLVDPERYLRLYGQGHPLHYTFIYLFTNLGWRLGDLTGPYRIGFLIEALNILLFFSLLKRIHSRALALMGSLVYVLYSADTTQAYLTFALGLQPSLTLLLLASHAYLSGKRWMAYPLAALTLLTYETCYPVFVAIPWLITGPRRPQRRTLLAHVLILGLILVAMILWRLAAEDDRVAGLNSLRSLLSVPVLHMLQGPPVSLGTYIYRPVQAVLALNTEVVLVTIIALAVWLGISRLLDLGRPARLEEGLLLAWAEIRQRTGLRDRTRRFWGQLPVQVRDLLRTALAGLAMLILAYPLTFTVRAYAISGRDTRVHAAAVIGAAVLLGAVLLLVMWFARSSRWRGAADIVLGLWIGLLAAYGFVIQRDYRLAWEYQKAFWSDLVVLLPDLQEATSILVDPSGLKDTRQIGANYWNLPVVLEQLYEFPPEWRRPPWVYRLADGWQSLILADDGNLSLDAATTFTPPSNHGLTDPGNTVLIETFGDRLRRVGGPLQLGEAQVQLRPVPQVLGEPAYTQGFLYPYLLGERAAPGSD